MPVTIDASKDYLVWDNTEGITYISAPRSRNNRFTVSVAKMRALSKSELIQDNGAYTSQDVAWLLPSLVAKPLTDSLAMKRGDVVLDERGTEWTVLSVTLGKWRNTWKLITRNLVLVEGLRDAITIMRPSINTGPGGEASMDSYSVVVADMPSRVQAMSQQRVVMNDIEGLHTMYQIILGQEVELKAQDRILFGDKVLQFDKYVGNDRLELLPVIDATEVAA